MADQTKTFDKMKFWRIVLIVAGLALLAFGLYRFQTQIKFQSRELLAKWLIGAVILHDFVLSPAVVLVGWLLARLVPPRARRYVQGALIAAGLVSIIAIPMIYREGSQPPQKALLRQHYGYNLAILVGLIAAVALLLYLRRVVLDRRTPAAANRQD